MLINCIQSDIPNHKILKLILHLFLRVLNCLKNVSQTNNHLFDTDKLLKRTFVFTGPGDQDESACKTYLTQIKDLRLRLEGCENRTVTRLRLPVDKEPLKACALKTAEQMVRHREEKQKFDMYGRLLHQTVFALFSPMTESPVRVGGLKERLELPHRED